MVHIIWTSEPYGPYHMDSYIWSSYFFIEIRSNRTSSYLLKAFKILATKQQWMKLKNMLKQLFPKMLHCWKWYFTEWFQNQYDLHLIWLFIPSTFKLCLAISCQNPLASCHCPLASSCHCLLENDPDDDLNSTTFIYISEKRINTSGISLTICHVILNENKMLVFHQVQILSL